MLCSNVAKIRKRICKDNVPISTAIAIYMGFGEKEKAREAFIEHIIYGTEINENMSRTEDINTILRPYKNLMDELDINFDAERAREVKRSRSNRW